MKPDFYNLILGLMTTGLLLVNSAQAVSAASMV